MQSQGKALQAEGTSSKIPRQDRKRKGGCDSHEGQAEWPAKLEKSTGQPLEDRRVWREESDVMGFAIVKVSHLESNVENGLEIPQS